MDSRDHGLDLIVPAVTMATKPCTTSTTNNQAIISTTTNLVVTSTMLLQVMVITESMIAYHPYPTTHPLLLLLTHIITTAVKIFV